MERDNQAFAGAQPGMSVFESDVTRPDQKKDNRVALHTVFRSVGLVNVGCHGHVEFESGQPEQPHMTGFRDRLRHGWKFQETPADGFCGLFALLMGADAVLGRGFSLVSGWRTIENYLFSPEYASDVTRELIEVEGTLKEDYEHKSFFSDRQLHLFAKRLAKEYLSNNDKMQVVFVAQQQHCHPLHLVFPAFEMPTVRAQVFVHHGGNHYQAFTPEFRGLDGVERSLKFDYKHTFDSIPQECQKPDERRNAHLYVPRQHDLMWLTGQTDVHPITGLRKFCSSPLTTDLIQRWFNIFLSNTVRQFYVAARATLVMKQVEYCKRYGGRFKGCEVAKDFLLGTASQLSFRTQRLINTGKVQQLFHPNGFVRGMGILATESAAKRGAATLKARQANGIRSTLSTGAIRKSPPKPNLHLTETQTTAFLQEALARHADALVSTKNNSPHPDNTVLSSPGAPVEDDEDEYPDPGEAFLQRGAYFY